MSPWLFKWLFYVNPSKFLLADQRDELVDGTQNVPGTI